MIWSTDQQDEEWVVVALVVAVASFGLLAYVALRMPDDDVLL